MTLQVGLEGFNPAESTAIGHLLHPFDVTISENNNANVIVSAGAPRKSAESITRPKIVDQPSRMGESNRRTILIPSDLIRECARIFESVLSPKVSLTYKLATGLPISYNIVPSSIRSRLLKKGQLDTNLTNHLSGETARRSVEQAFSASGFPLREREPPKFLITHDIDTAKGLEKALPMKAVEDKLDLRSTWFLSSGDYLTSKDTAKDLGSNATIGSHDVKHDGKLIHIHNRKRLVDRLKESRDKLEHVFERDVQCFRSPLLQFSSVLINALAEAGYRYDFSLPCWEPSHPITMSGFGVELTKPLQIGEILETPLSLFQDHQVLYVLGLSPREAIRFWVEQARIIKSYDGDIVLLVHPDYEFSSDLDSYRELLLALKNISDRSFHVDPE